jgi:hypothetical protein
MPVVQGVGQRGETGEYQHKTSSKKPIRFHNKLLKGWGLLLRDEANLTSVSNFCNCNLEK